MKTEEAQKKANELWGENAFADFIASGNGWTPVSGIYAVGETHGPFKQIYGYGKSWDDAFKNAYLNLN